MLKNKGKILFLMWILFVSAFIWAMINQMPHKNIPEPIKIAVPETKPTSNVNPDSILATAQKLLGSPYLEGGESPKGFDCSGFAYYVYQQNGLTIPRSSQTLFQDGQPVDKCSATKGDIIVFTGTNANDTTAGHVGIVIENIDCKISFIHSSSGKVNGVTISYLTDSHYEKRFLSIRRYL
jgi:cell wall-associated NlpC family hydrolase